jgi:hypothetical protein
MAELALCLDKAPPNRTGSGPDRSRADYVWCMIAISWSHGVDDTAARLLQESAKAREEGKSYGLQTARQAEAAVGTPPAAATAPLAVGRPRAAGRPRATVIAVIRFRARACAA